MDPYHQNYRPPLHPSASANSLGRISDISDFNDSDGVRPRPSLVSLQSNDAGHGRAVASGGEGHSYAPTQSGWSAFTSYSNGAGYEPVPLGGETPASPPRRYPSRSFAHTSSTRRRHEPIPEEDDGVDLGLIRSAAPLGVNDPPPLIQVTSNGHFDAFDITSALGPTTKADEDFLKRLQEQEANGKLTGGLGTGLNADVKVVTESSLLATSPVLEKPPLLRSLSRAHKSGLDRRMTVKQLGQHEANKRGEVVEVIMDKDEPGRSEVDLSIMAGPDALPGPGQFGMRPATFASKAERTQVFYPQPNWKPFSMRWPYLLALIIISIVLGVVQEVMYRMSTAKPLVTFHTPSEIPTADYIAFKFLPTIIAVSYGVLWQVTDFEVKRLEAFFQLSKEGGALAAESINVDYITYFSFFRPYRAFRCGHYAVVVSSVASLLANAAVPTLSAACIILFPDRRTRAEDPDQEKQVLIHGVWSRLLTAVLIVIAFLGCVLLYQLQTRRSGLMADVKGIAGLASMAVAAHILMDFKDMDVATHTDIHHKLKNHRYVLRNCSLAPDETNPPTKQERDKYATNHLSINPQPLMLRPHGIIPFIVVIALFTLFIPIVLFTPASVLTDRAAWSITALSVCIKLGWGGLETDVRMMEPYYILSRRHAPSKTLTLDYTAMPFGWVAIQGLLNKHWLVFAVGFGTILTEVLTVLVTSLATVEGRVFIDLIRAPEGEGSLGAGQETPKSFWISLTLAILILGYMGAVAGVVCVRRRKVFLPRQPNTIASVLAYIHQSKMLYDFVGTAKLSNQGMVKKLEGIGKTYGLGWFQGRDGQSHCGVDEEELLSAYRFGYDYSRATKPWEEEQVNWL
ncbi:hypothetical protein OQA88_3395 [Cercophora sp. LCS_1]